MARIALRPQARRDLTAIWTYSAEAWGEAQAERYLRELSSRLDMLEVHPKLGRKCDFILPGYRVYPSGEHLIFYKTSADEIDVVRILHKRMDAKRHFPSD